MTNNRIGSCYTDAMWFFRRKTEQKQKKLVKRLIVGVIIGTAIGSVIGKKMLDQDREDADDEQD